jgi:hypothetical protein
MYAIQRTALSASQEGLQNADNIIYHAAMVPLVDEEPSELYDLP